MNSHFFAVLSRMKYIERWALMRNARHENLSEHSLEVAMIAHALCVIGNARFQRDLNADRAAVKALYHDAGEIITGDMPTPVKYYNESIRKAYHQVEDDAEQQLLGQLPEDLQEEYQDIFARDEQLDLYIKAADKLSALIKCIEERSAGNTEFITAEKSTREALIRMTEGLPEITVFMEEFLPSYGKTLDELLERND
ncbi:MAG: 5'-deoxynucleotidase [Solobacterium sp.]|nr:5'-deoxynucleotidase [Solobacterium sp.]MBR2991257.1 5'-deoxynucleotidase [Solobacterium sp.]